MKKTIITIVDGLHYRYLVESGVLRLVLPEVSESIIFTTTALLENVKKNTAGASVQVKILEPIELTLRKKLYLFLKDASNQNLSETINQKNEVKKKKKLLTYISSNVLRVISETALYKPLDKLLGSSFKSLMYRKIIKDFSPDLIVFSTPGQKLPDLPLLYEAKKAGVKTISPVYSWDNLSGKGPFIFNVDRLIVWNRIMKDEAQYYHGYSDDAVDAVGVPVFDTYPKIINEAPEMRVKFLTNLNLNSELKTITVTTVPRIFFGSCHNNIIKKLIEFIKQKQIPEVNILIRPHPKDDTDYSKWKDEPLVKVDFYGSIPDDSLVNWIPEENNTFHLGRTMLYSDIVINIASTITIDASCFDTPIINIAYDIKDSESDYIGSIARYYRYTHYQHVVKLGAATMVKSDLELIQAINQYLKDRSIHSTERKQLVEQQTGVLDGKAHQRVAEVILKNLN